MSETEMLLSAAGAQDAAASLASAISAAAKQLGTADGAASMQSLVFQMAQLRDVGTQQVEAVGGNTRAVLQNTIAVAAPKAGTSAGDVARTALGVLTAGTSPLLRGLIGLFTGGTKQETPPPLLAYARPVPLAIEGETSRNEGLRWQWPEGLERTRPAVTQTAAPQITVQVQAIDSRSFLEHKDEIARAVRQAVLHSHSLVDAINEL